MGEVYSRRGDAHIQEVPRKLGAFVQCSPGTKKRFIDLGFATDSRPPRGSVVQRSMGGPIRHRDLFPNLQFRPDDKKTPSPGLEPEPIRSKAPSCTGAFVAGHLP